MRRRPPHASPVTQAQRGLTLVEIMVAMTLGLLLLGGVLQIFLGSRQTYRMQEAASRLQENARYAVESLASDLRAADFFGCANRLQVTNNLDPAGAGYEEFSASGIMGEDGPAGTPDSITINGAFGIPLQVLPPYGPQPSAAIVVAAPNDLAVGDIVLVSDCTAGDIFQITGGNPGHTGVLVHETGAAVSPGNYNHEPCSGGNAHCLSKVYQGDAYVYRVQSVTYSVGAGAGGAPALFRNGQELVEGVENMQILYGEDTDDDGVPNRYLPADEVNSMDAVTSIRISLLLRSLDDNVTQEPQTYTYNGATVTAGDRRLRRVVTMTVSLRNRLP